MNEYLRHSITLLLRAKAFRSGPWEDEASRTWHHQEARRLEGEAAVERVKSAILLELRESKDPQPWSHRTLTLKALQKEADRLDAHLQTLSHDARLAADRLIVARRHCFEHEHNLQQLSQAVVREKKALEAPNQEPSPQRWRVWSYARHRAEQRKAGEQRALNYAQAHDAWAFHDQQTFTQHDRVQQAMIAAEQAQSAKRSASLDLEALHESMRSLRSLTALDQHQEAQKVWDGWTRTHQKQKTREQWDLIRHLATTTGAGPRSGVGAMPMSDHVQRRVGR